MLASIRKFSTSIYAKILLGIVVIPFVFWGMGSSFGGGNKNIVVVIEKEKYSTEQFANFVQNFVTTDEKLSSEQVDEFLAAFIGNQLIEKEIEHFGIKLSDNSLRNLIKHQKEFKKNNKFSRIEYEKFLLTNNIRAVTFENNLEKNEKKKQFLEFIGGGVIPPKFLVNSSYDKFNQKRNIQIINLNDLYDKEFNFTDTQIKSYYENNKINYKETYKSAKILELNPKKLIDSDEYTDIFFKKLDEVDDAIIQSQNFDSIIKKFNLEKPKTLTFNLSGKDINSNILNNLPKSLIKNIFQLDDTELTTLIEDKDKFFIVEVTKTEVVQKDLYDKTTKESILDDLEKSAKRKIISKIVAKINQGNFSKSDFDKLSKEKNLTIKSIVLQNQDDNKNLKKILVNEIYRFPENKIGVVHDINLGENFLVYIDEIENVTIDKKSDEYKKYLGLSAIKITNDLYNTYDSYIKKKYKIDVNYKALNIVKNYFN